MEHRDGIALDINDKEKAKGMLQAFIDFDITVSNRPAVLFTGVYDEYGKY